MMKAHIQIDDELAVKAFRKALRFQAVKEVLSFYSKALMVVWIVVAVADAVLGAEHLIKWHLLFLAGLAVIGSIYSYVQWEKKLAQTKGWSFYAELDHLGVTTRSPNEARYEWDAYTGYTEYDDYLQIAGPNGAISFLPKTPELFEVIEFTKDKIPRK